MYDHLATIWKKKANKHLSRISAPCLSLNLKFITVSGAYWGICGTPIYSTSSSAKVVK